MLVYLNEKIKIGLRKIFTETTSQENLKMRQWVKPIIVNKPENLGPLCNTLH
jgi:hypothetical protein